MIINESLGLRGSGFGDQSRLAQLKHVIGLLTAPQPLLAEHKEFKPRPGDTNEAWTKYLTGAGVQEITADEIAAIWAALKPIGEAHHHNLWSFFKADTELHPARILYDLVATLDFRVVHQMLGRAIVQVLGIHRTMRLIEALQCVSRPDDKHYRADTHVRIRRWKELALAASFQAAGFDLGHEVGTDGRRDYHLGHLLAQNWQAIAT